MRSTRWRSRKEATPGGIALGGEAEAVLERGVTVVCEGGAGVVQFEGGVRARCRGLAGGGGVEGRGGEGGAESGGKIAEDFGVRWDGSRSD